MPIQSMMPDIEEGIVTSNFVMVKEWLTTQQLTRDEQLQLWQLASHQIHTREQELARKMPTSKRFGHVVLSSIVMTAGVAGVLSFYTDESEGAMNDLLKITQSAICVIVGGNKFIRAVLNKSGKQEYATAIAIQKLIEDYRQPRIQESELE